ncbi:hypothetical protein JCM10449v2_006798 [Rhodotorula kratochvilovae]
MSPSGPPPTPHIHPPAPTVLLDGDPMAVREPPSQHQQFTASPSPLTAPSSPASTTHSAPFSLRSTHLRPREGGRPADLFAASAYAHEAEGEALFGPAPRSPLPAREGEGGEGERERRRLREKYALRPEQEEVLGRMMRGVWERFGAREEKRDGRGSQWPRAPPPETPDPPAEYAPSATAREQPFSLPASPPSTRSSRRENEHRRGGIEAVLSPGGSDDWMRSAPPPPPRTPFPSTTPLDSPPVRTVTPAESPRSVYRSRPPSPRSAPLSIISGLSPPASPPAAGAPYTHVADRTLTPMPSPPSGDAGAPFPFAARERAPLFRSLGWAYLPARSGARTTRAPLVDGELGAEEAEWVRTTGRVPDDGGTRDWWGNPVGMGGEWGRAVLSPIVTETEPSHSSPALSGRSAASFLLRSPHHRAASVPPGALVDLGGDHSPRWSDRSAGSSAARARALDDGALRSPLANGVILPVSTTEPGPHDASNEYRRSDGVGPRDPLAASGTSFASRSSRAPSEPFFGVRSSAPPSSAFVEHLGDSRTPNSLASGSASRPSSFLEGSEVLPPGVAYNPSLSQEEYAHASTASPPRSNSFFLGDGASSRLHTRECDRSTRGRDEQLSTIPSNGHLGDFARSTPLHSIANGSASHPSSFLEESESLPPGVAYDPSLSQEDYAHASTAAGRANSFSFGDGASSRLRSRGDPSSALAGEERLSTIPSTVGAEPSLLRWAGTSPARSPRSAGPPTAPSETVREHGSSSRAPPSRSHSDALDSLAHSRSGTGESSSFFGGDESLPPSQGELDSPENAAHFPPSSWRDSPLDDAASGTARPSSLRNDGGFSSNGYPTTASRSSPEHARSGSTPSTGSREVMSLLVGGDPSSPSRRSRSRLSSSFAPDSSAAHGGSTYPDQRLSTIPSSGLASPSHESPLSPSFAHDRSFRSSAVLSPSRSSRTASPSRNGYDHATEPPLSPTSFSTAASHLPSSSPFTPSGNGVLSPSRFGEGATQESAVSPSSFGAAAACVPGSWDTATAAQASRSAGLSRTRASGTSGTTTPRRAQTAAQGTGTPSSGSSATETRSEEISRWASGVPLGAEDAEEAVFAAMSAPETSRSGESSAGSTTTHGGTFGARTPAYGNGSSSLAPDRSASRSTSASPTKSSSFRSPRATTRSNGVLSPSGISRSSEAFSPGTLPPTPSEYVSASEQLVDGRERPLLSPTRGSRASMSTRSPSSRTPRELSCPSARSPPPPTSSLFRGERTSASETRSFSSPPRPADNSCFSSTASPPRAHDSPLFGTGSPASTPPRVPPIPLSFPPSVYSPSRETFERDFAEQQPRPFAPPSIIPSSTTRRTSTPAGPDLSGAGGQLSLDSLTTTPKSPPLVATPTLPTRSPRKGETPSSFAQRYPPPSPTFPIVDDGALYDGEYGTEQDYGEPTVLSPARTAHDGIPSPVFSPASPPSPSAYSSSAPRRYVPRPPVKPPRGGPGPFQVPQLSEEEKRARRELRKQGRSPEWDLPLEETKSGRRKRAWEEMQAFEKERARLFKLLGDPLTEQDVPVLNALARLYLDSSNLAVREQAVHFMQNSLQLDEAQPDMARILALQLEDSDLEEAIAWHRYAVERGPDDPERHLSLGHCLLRAGDAGGASHVFLNIARSFTDDPYEAIALYELGRLYQQHGGAEERTHAVEAYESALACLTRLKLERPEVRLGERWDELDLVERAVLRGLQEAREGRRSTVKSPFASRHATPHATPRATPRGPLSPVSPTIVCLPPATPPSTWELRPASRLHHTRDELLEADPASRSPTVLNEALPSQPPPRSPRKKHRRKMSSRRLVDPETARTLDTILSSLSRLSRTSPAAELSASTRTLAEQVERTYAGLLHLGGEEAAQRDELHRALDDVQRELGTLPDRLVSSAKLAAARPANAPAPPTAHDPLEEALRKLERARRLAV